MKDKTLGVVIGVVSPHLEKIFVEHAWWTDWVKPSLQSFVGAIIGLLVIHYGKKLLHSFDNWRNVRKLGKFRQNGKNE